MHVIHRMASEAKSRSTHILLLANDWLIRNRNVLKTAVELEDERRRISVSELH